MRLAVAAAVIVALVGAAVWAQSNSIPREPLRLEVPDGGLPVSADLNPSSLNAIGTTTCSYGRTRRVSLTTTATTIPTSEPLSNRTGIGLANADGQRSISCDVVPADGGVPDCAVPGFGTTLAPNGGFLFLGASNADVVKCVACTGGGARLEYKEESCVTP